ncbi:hypothetical protein A4G19_02195 [Pasteurellaceae bacterium Macca]|nr:hypothetical protein [Pasteurellaceae bacterium Macca]
MTSPYWQIIAYPQGQQKPVIVGSETELNKAMTAIKQVVKANPHYHAFTLRKFTTGGEHATP